MWVSGTTGNRADGSVPPDAMAQMRVALRIIERALADAGASMAEVVAVRVYVTDIEEWEGVAATLREQLEPARLAVTMVHVARLMLPEHRVKIELEAVVGSAG